MQIFLYLLAENLYGKSKNEVSYLLFISKYSKKYK